MKTSELFLESLAIRDKLKKEFDFAENRIDDTLLPVLPFRISTEIKLIFLGQDPTVKNEESRKSIEYTLNLDKRGSLRTYLSGICNAMDLTLENVYSTNLVKYFYTLPPERTMHVLHAHLPENLALLKEELAAYPKAKIITLGLPVLQLLAGESAQVRDFWDYDKKTRASNGGYCKCMAVDNKLRRDIYPFPHQPSIIKEFYKNHLVEYIGFVSGE